VRTGARGVCRQCGKIYTLWCRQYKATCSKHCARKAYEAAVARRTFTTQDVPPDKSKPNKV
jgi:hypothetical protein